MGLRPAALTWAVLALGLAGCLAPASSPLTPTPLASPPPASPTSAVIRPSAGLTPARLAPEPPDRPGSPPAHRIFLPVIVAALEPARLVIPALDLAQPIVPVPVVAGVWDIAELGSAVGWLATTGAEPGAALAPALVGHVSMPNGTSGPFGYLWRLRLGADVYYEWLGWRYHYRVDDKRTVAPETVEALYLADGQRLLLVTCDGWDFARWNYTERLVIAAVLTGVEPAD